jgi:hypothetical protein
LPVFPSVCEKAGNSPFIIETEFGTSETKETKRSKQRNSKEREDTRPNDHFGSNELMAKTYEILDQEI